MTLTVWYRQQKVGRLILLADRRMAFAYDGDWLRQGWAISCSLPLNETGDFLPPDMRGHHFFANLLPEGDARHRLIRRFGISDDDFILLDALGGDCAGALQLLPEGATPGAGKEHLAPIALSTLTRAIPDGAATLLAPGEPPRLSLAGAQDKLAVRARQTSEGQWEISLPEGGVPSSHILKFPVQGLRHVPIIEVYTTYIARQLGLPVAEIELLTLGEHRVSLSTRYDRRSQEGELLRLHQEDFCQAQGLGATAKYGDQGARLGPIANILREHALQPARDVRTLVSWQIFNALAGNTDAHLKNVALLAEDGAWRLAPFYDLVCTLAIPQVSHRLAMPVGSCNDPQNLRLPHWQGLAKDVGVSPRLVLRLIKEQAEQLLEELNAWHTRFNQQYDVAAETDPVRNLIRRQYRKALRDWLK